ncbi:hypothetical protein Q1695_014408 [Nippostrongylus brasiliensis]|nr:hypothetical protein Q1695_014408 [Nippostrongylus brasiliensis]
MNPSLRLLIFFVLVQFKLSWQTTIRPTKLTIIVGRTEEFTLSTPTNITTDVEVLFKQQPNVEVLKPLKLSADTKKGSIRLRGLQVINEYVFEPESCNSSNNNSCDQILSDFHLDVTVLKSAVIASLVMIVGWSYFTAWSVSFYPQIFLNYKRKSVVGLNFDFLVLNIVGFTAYSAYNVFLYFDSRVQRQYEEAHPHSPIPVLLNDVFFAVHALFACIVTAAQCFIYQRGNQRVSNTCLGITGAMLVAAVATGVVTFYDGMNMLQFVTSLSYIKMIVTLLKYIPQAILNYRRKSTVGWSIGNVLLDFTGGCLDILQMCLQCWNVSDWSAFYGNPVKFGLGLVSSLFDILFITQHYVLYPQHKVPGDLEKADRYDVDGNPLEKLSAADRQSGTDTAPEKVDSLDGGPMETLNSMDRQDISDKSSRSGDER